MLRFNADYRTLLWALIPPTLIGVGYARPEWVPFLFLFCCYFAFACGVMAHNHNHCPTFKNRTANDIFANWLSVFYGYPTFAWIPTHNLNHHKFTNAEGDATITWRYSNRHNFLVASTYFFVSSYWQSEPINGYIKKARTSNRPLYRKIMMQYAVWLGANAAMIALGIGLHGVSTGLWVWAGTMGIPAFFSLWMIMLVNYDQHVHADPDDPTAHSRSFESPILNFLLFNNGYHFVHHEKPGTHWSKLKGLHDEARDRIHPDLLVRSVWLYWLKQYVLAPFFPKLGTKQIGPEPHFKEEPVGLASKT